MRRKSPILAALAAVLVATPAIANPFVFVGGDAYLEASANNGTVVNRAGTPVGTYGGPAFGPSGGYSVTAASGPASSSAFFQHSTSANSISIGGTTTANLNFSGFPSNGGTVSAYGLAAPNPPGGATDYGYVIDFQVTQQTLANLNINFTPTLNATDGNNAYADIGLAYLARYNADQTAFEEVYDFGAFNELNPDGSDSFGDFLYENLLLNPGLYQLYIQSQSFVSGATGSASAQADVGITLTGQPTALIPEPLSCVVFGGLLAGGGLVARRRMKAKVA